MLQLCPNGARRLDEHNAVPVTPEQVAADVRAVVPLGVGSVHLHPRVAGGPETMEPEEVAAAVAAVRAVAPGIEVGVTTAAWVEPDPTRRVAHVLRWAALGQDRPDVASVNVHEDGWREVVQALRMAGIGVELGVWTAADAAQVREAGLVDGAVRVLVEVVDPDPNDALAEARRIIDELGDTEAPLLLHGEDSGCWAVLAEAGRRQLATRIGLEDTLLLPDGRVATSNAELVATARRLLGGNHTTHAN
ncbi:Uncharacterized conserved protein, DUF849 family [Streptoalloteichus tenebrarius]|uniref:Uncharacterized conserved protein, DUF849 family n=1 Tax=Streptoalloteichus tenebrarius (strain ATCC 17920 / DSM 40477 / JCM 4838 / CBS 697.72 / NBRC 16177 / NCIMB 11028 / NRRL B-12390 / A12253. 1 / ISP 5477) TaxID=1933 RepID=A0ABT1HWN7_STRSD|nr:3-keto-5-aminohexanoate cleavage protein [Streptoalloteichus tenebrarius]MCP2259936.1 Uncharacterized conserved protein, DUF849 family [Streptoalloteichus tenebrarius]BFF03261.1 3-keto-5-aminohexanoate cleavage protein [Streptoalloteichus tenebrarius]